MSADRNKQGGRHKPFAARRVLLVDDDADVRQMIGTVLTRLGATVEEAATAVQAKKLLEDRSFDALLLDWNLPDSSGDAFLDWLSQSRPLLRRRTLVITGRLTPLRSADEGGWKDVALLAKPFRPDELESALAGLLRCASGN